MIERSNKFYYVVCFLFKKKKNTYRKKFQRNEENEKPINIYNGKTSVCCFILQEKL